MTEMSEVKKSAESRQQNHLKSIGFSLLLILYSNFHNQLTAGKLDFIILFGIFVFYVLVIKPDFYVWMILTLILAIFLYRDLELIFMLCTLIVSGFLKSKSIKKYGKNLNLMIGSAFTVSLASGKTAISELDITFTITTFTFLILGEWEFINVLALNDLTNLGLKYGY